MRFVPIPLLRSPWKVTPKNKEHNQNKHNKGGHSPGTGNMLACKNIRFSSLFATGDVSCGGVWFASSVWNFCRWVADVPPPEMFPAAKSEEKRMFSQASNLQLWVILTNNTNLHLLPYYQWNRLNYQSVFRKWAHARERRKLGLPVEVSLVSPI